MLLVSSIGTGTGKDTAIFCKPADFTMWAEFQDDWAKEPVLRAYLLGSVDFEAFLHFQRRLHFEVTGDRERAALVLCEHPPLITVGRQGSRSHIRLEADELRHRHWPIRWVGRGGGCILHVPGQLAVYPILALDRLGCGIAEYLWKLGAAIRDLLSEFSIRRPIRVTEAGVWVGDRLLAAFGASVRSWVTSFGVYINVNPALEPYRWVRSSDAASPPMTSLECERRGPVRPALVRERLLQHLRRHFGFDRTTLFTDHRHCMVGHKAVKNFQPPATRAADDIFP
jgi:lipoyl(octanoyl) transferase